MSYDPVHNNVLVANNSASPTPYTTLFNASTGAVISQTVFDGTKNTPNAVGNSIEASIYDPAKDVFWLAIPQIGPSASDPGGLSEVNATTGAVIATFSFAGVANANGCSPTGRRDRRQSGRHRMREQELTDADLQYRHSKVHDCRL